jgi:F0F1-type ATP synthase assembly protein I
LSGGPEPGVPDPRDDGPERGGTGGYLRFLHLGTQLAITLVLGVFGGRWLDGRWGTGPWLTVVGALAGIAVGMAVLIREVEGGRR